MPDYLPNDIGEIIGDVLAEAKKPGVKRPNVPLSKKQLDVHYDDIYLGYLKQISDINRRLKTTNRKSQSWNEFRSLKRDELHALNGIRLHELYFGGFGKTKSSSLVDTHILKSFGKKSEWENDFIACGMCAKGWVTLGYDKIDKKLRNITSDVHEMSACCVEPILTMDMYEHAYMIDFGSSKGKYIEFFLEHTSWDEVTNRLSGILNDAT